MQFVQTRIAAFQTMTDRVQFNDIDDDDADDSRRDIGDTGDTDDTDNIDGDTGCNGDTGDTSNDRGGTDDIDGDTSDAGGAIGGEAVKANSKLEPSATWPKRHRREWLKRISATERDLQLDELQFYCEEEFRV